MKNRENDAADFEFPQKIDIIQPKINELFIKKK